MQTEEEKEYQDAMEEQHHKLQDLPTFIHIKIQITDPEEKYLETARMMNSKHEIKSLKTFLGDHRTGQQPF